MHRPQNLIPGDRIAIVAPARKISPNELLDATNILTSWGLEVILGQNIFNEDNQYAGRDQERADDFQQMIDDPEVKAILFARGGYGSIRIMDKINWEKFKINPKWLIGFSDITVIHSYLSQQLEVESLHGIMAINFPTASESAIESVRKVIFGETLSYSVKAHLLNKVGSTKSQIIGGNLSLLHTLCGSDCDIKTDGKILFIEDLDEYLYHIDRMMLNLKRSGKLESLAGLIVGGMTEMNDNKVPFGKTAYEIIYEHIEKYHYPACFGFPAGHISNHCGIILGRTVELKVDAEVQLNFEK